MLLAVDIGNSFTKFAYFDGKTLESKFSIPTNQLSFQRSFGEQLQKVTDVIVCSVVPEAEHELAAVLRETLDIDPVLVRNHFKSGLTINYQPLDSLGTDRLVNAFAAAEKYGVPCIVCSFGTAATFDVVSNDREFLGGAITPGVHAMAKALRLNTSQLPEVEIMEPEFVIGTSTTSAIQSGIFYGQIGIAEAIISRLKNEIDTSAKVIATGGFAATIAKHTDQIDVVDENLLLDGLRMLHETN